MQNLEVVFNRRLFLFDQADVIMLVRVRAHLFFDDVSASLLFVLLLVDGVEGGAGG